MLLFVLTWGKGFVGGRLTGKESEARWNCLEHAEEVLGSPHGQGRGPGAGLLPGEAAGAGGSSARHRGAAHHTGRGHVLGGSGCTERPARGAVLSCGPDRGP